MQFHRLQRRLKNVQVRKWLSGFKWLQKPLILRGQIESVWTVAFIHVTFSWITPVCNEPFSLFFMVHLITRLCPVIASVWWYIFIYRQPRPGAGQQRRLALMQVFWKIIVDWLRYLSLMMTYHTVPMQSNAIINLHTMPSNLYRVLLFQNTFFYQRKC